MAAGKSVLDGRAQMAAMLVTESAANTLTVGIFNFPFSIMDKMALSIVRIEYWPTWDKLVGAIDELYMAIIAAKTVSDLSLQTDPAIVDSCEIMRTDFGTAAAAQINVSPIVKDFSNLPGGGLLVAPNPLAFAIKGSSLQAAASAWVRIHYTYMQLSTDEYWQLVESRRIISST